MRDIANKVDGVDTLPAAAFNSDQSELENAVTSSDQTLDPNAGPDTDLNMLGKAMAAYANAANVYDDSGAADAYVLSIATNLKAVTKYYDNMMIVFKAGNSNTGASTVNVETLGVKDIKLPDGTALGAGDIISGKYVTAIYNLSDDRFEIVKPVIPGGSVQVVSTQDGAVATGTTALPNDDTIPQITEGDEYMTLAITPKRTTNKLIIEVIAFFSQATGGALTMSMGLFKDTTPDALSAAQVYSDTNNQMCFMALRHEVIAGTISPITFRIRAGTASGATTFNGLSGVRKLGGVMASSIVITEIQV